MLRTRTSRWIAAGVVAALLVAAGTAVAGEGGRRGRKARQRHMARAMERIEALSDEQAKAATWL